MGHLSNNNLSSKGASLNGVDEIGIQPIDLDVPLYIPGIIIQYTVKVPNLEPKMIKL